MPRLEGEKKSPLPLILGLLALLAVGAIAYFLLANRGTDAGGTEGETPTTEVAPTPADSGGDNSANGTDANATSTPSADATPTVDPDATPTVDPLATPTVDPLATPTVDPAATPTVDPAATPADGAAVSNTADNSATSPAFRRSKTITNNKTGTTTTYSKEVAPNGATLSRSQNSTSPTPVATP